MKKLIKKNAKKILVMFLIFSFCSAVITGCSRVRVDPKTGKRIITVGYLPITHALAAFEQKEMAENEISDYEIKLQRFSNWTDLMDALNSGRIDAAPALIELAMMARTNGIDVKAAVLGHREGNLIVAANDIKSAADLRGKKFAIPSRQSSQFLLVSEMLRSEGLDLSDVELIQMSPSEMPSSLATGSIAGYCVAEPFGTAAITGGYGHVISDPKALWNNSICCGLIFNGSFTEKNTELARKFLND